MLVGCLLAASGGFQDAYTYNVRDQVFANAQTGNMVLVGQSLALGQWEMALEHFVPVAAFAAGVFAAEVVHNRFHSRNLAFHWRQAVVLLEAAILLLVAFLPYGLNLLANVLVSFVCAMQVESFRKIEGNTYATTMCIGNFRSGTECLYRWRKTRDRGFLHRAKVYYVVILVFVLGAALGGLACRAWGRVCDFDLLPVASDLRRADGLDSAQRKGLGRPAPVEGPSWTCWSHEYCINLPKMGLAFCDKSAIISLQIQFTF